MIAKYDAWICGQPELMAALHQLRGGDLACWCAPEAYDGEKLLELASWAAASNGRMAICAIVARRSSARWPTGWPALAHSGYCTTSPAWPALPLALMYTSGRSAPITCGWLAMSDLEVDETQLEMVQRHVRETEERIALQDALIRRMERNGEYVLAEIGRNLLEDLRQSLHEARDHVERLQDLQH